LEQELEYAEKNKVTRCDRFLSDINIVAPWAALVSVLAPHYSKSDQRGRPPNGLERMLRICVMQQCFGLSAKGIEHAIYDSQANLILAKGRLTKLDAQRPA
jgi:IS5 family transposase